MDQASFLHVSLTQGTLGQITKDHHFSVGEKWLMFPKGGGTDAIQFTLAFYYY